MKLYLPLCIILFLITSFGYAQTDPLFDRLRAINYGRTTYYNIDGINISSESLNEEYNEKSLKKAFRKYKIKKNDTKISTSQIDLEHLFVRQDDTISNKLTENISNYFIKKTNGKLEVIWFMGLNYKSDKNFEQKMIQYILADKIPKSCFSPLDVDKLNFVGREVTLGGDCRWTHLNRVLCPYYGQISWSIHKDKENATTHLADQLEKIKIRKGGKIISSEEVDIIFEKIPTKAKKIIYDFTGVNSILAGMTGGKTLTAYYLVQKVRGQYISVIMSFWNNDNINPSGLPALLEEFMRLE